MKFPLISGIFAMVVLLGQLCVVGTASAGNKGDMARAQKHFNSGITLMKSQDFVSAAKEFESSIALHPTKNGYFNLASCYLKTQQFDKAVLAINRLQERFAEELDDEWEEEISVFRKKLDEGACSLEIQVNIDESEVFVNGTSIGKSPIEEPIMLSRGKHQISASRNGYETDIKSINLEIVPDLVVRLTLAKAASIIDQNASDDDGSDDDSSKGQKRVWTWVSYGIGGAAGIAAIITGSKQLSLTREIKEQCVNTTCDMALKSDADRAKTLGRASNVLVTITAVGLVLGTVLFFVEAPKPEKRSTAFVPTVFQNGGGLSVYGTF